MQSRSDWNAAPRQLGADFVPSQVLGVAVHWNGPRVGTGVARGDKAAVASYLRGVQRFHMSGRGWSDIAYNRAVDNAGRRWDLRGWTRRSGANGDAEVNRKYGAILCVIGEGQRPTEAMLDALRDEIAEFRRHFPRAKAIKGHQDVRPDPTACPGPDLERAVRLGRLDPSRAVAVTKPPRPAPAPPPPPIPDPIAQEDDTMFVIYNGQWYLAGNGHLVAVTRNIERSGDWRIVTVDDLTWSRLVKAYDVVPEGAK